MLHCGYYARHKFVDALGGVPYQSRLSFLGTARQAAECATITAFQGAAITSSAAEGGVTVGDVVSGRTCYASRLQIPGASVLLDHSLY